MPTRQSCGATEGALGVRFDVQWRARGAGDSRLRVVTARRHGKETDACDAGGPVPHKGNTSKWTQIKFLGEELPEVWRTGRVACNALGRRYGDREESRSSGRRPRPVLAICARMLSRRASSCVRALANRIVGIFQKTLRHNRGLY